MTSYLMKIRPLFLTNYGWVEIGKEIGKLPNVSLCNIAIRVVVFTFHVIFVNEPEVLLEKCERCTYFLNTTYLSIFFLISFTLRTPRFLVTSITSATSRL